MEKIIASPPNIAASPSAGAPAVLALAPPQWSGSSPLDDHARAASQIREDLWSLSAQCLESWPWPLHWYRNRRYRNLLSGYCELLPELAKDENRDYLNTALIGLSHIRAKNLAISMAILRDLKFHIVPGEAIVYVMKGLFYFVIVASFVTYLAIALLHSTLEGGVIYQLLNVFIAFIFGLLGSVVSLLNRLSRLEQTSTKSQAYCVYTGATSPIVGGITAAVVACLIQAKVVSFEGADFSANSWFFVVIGFLSGFSERFSGNLLRIAQTRISGPIDDKGISPNTESRADVAPHAA